MEVKIYNKLVRDQIPEIIEADGKTCVTEMLSGEQYFEMLDAKLDEELAEYQESKSLEEMADLLEVMQAVVKARGWTWKQLEQTRQEKAAKRGGFEKKLLLKEVIAPGNLNSLVADICGKQSIIFAKIDEKVLSTYCWLIDNLHTRNIFIDQEYRQRFSAYYRMRFVSANYRNAFFDLFEQIKDCPVISFEEVAVQLYKIDSRHEFSFITKMLHTIDPTRPIYDSRVDAALHIRRAYRKDFDEKLRQDAKILTYLSTYYRELKSSPRMAEMLIALDKIAPSCRISTEKKLDFILWAFGAC